MLQRAQRGALGVGAALLLALACSACASRKPKPATTAGKADAPAAPQFHLERVAVGTTAELVVLSNVEGVPLDVAWAEPADAKTMDVVGWSHDVVKLRARIPGVHTVSITARRGDEDLQLKLTVDAQPAVSMAFLAAGCPSLKVVQGSRVRIPTRLLNAALEELAGTPPFPKVEPSGVTLRAGAQFLDVLVAENVKGPVILKAPRGMRLAGDEEAPGKGYTLLGLDGSQRLNVVPQTEVTDVVHDGWLLAPPLGPLPAQHYVHHVVRGGTLELFVRAAPPLCGMLPIQVTNHSPKVCALEGPTADHAVRVVTNMLGDCRLSATLQKPLTRPLSEPLLFTVAVQQP